MFVLLLAIEGLAADGRMYVHECDAVETGGLANLAARVSERLAALGRAWTVR
jgi:hypothetical protein